jgi:hypothetical protein
MQPNMPKLSCGGCAWLALLQACVLFWPSVLTAAALSSAKVCDPVPYRGCSGGALVHMTYVIHCMFGSWCGFLKRAAPCGDMLLAAGAVHEGTCTHGMQWMKASGYDFKMLLRQVAMFFCCFLGTRGPSDRSNAQSSPFTQMRQLHMEQGFERALTCEPCSGDATVFCGHSHHGQSCPPSAALRNFQPLLLACRQAAHVTYRTGSSIPPSYSPR